MTNCARLAFRGCNPPVATTRLGQILERTRFRFEPLEPLEHGRAYRWFETAVHLGDILERTRLVITDEDRAEVPGSRIFV
jgi:hypothetical protein